MASTSKDTTFGNGPIIRPISQVYFQLEGVNSYQSAIRECVAWIKKRAKKGIPSQAFNGTPFDTAGTFGAQHATAVQVEGDDARIWAARLSDADKRVAQRNWITELSVGQRSNIVQFSARLTQITLGSDTDFEPTVPGVVQQIVKSMRAIQDGTKLTEADISIEDDESYDWFLHLLNNKYRVNPIVAISITRDSQSAFNPSMLSKRLCGSAHVISISEDYSWRLTREYGKEFSVFFGSARIYNPNFNQHGDPYEHNLLLVNKFSNEIDATSHISRLILPQTFLSRSDKLSIPRFEDIRRASSEAAMLRASNNDTSKEDQIRIAHEEINRLSNQIENDRVAQQQLLDEAEIRRASAENARSAAHAEAAQMRERIKHLQRALKAGQTSADESLSNLDQIDQWSEKHLAGHVIILNSAVRETKNSIFRDITALTNALLLLRDFYIPMRRGEITRQVFDAEAKKLGIAESATFSNPGDMKAFPGYRKSYRGETVWLDRHLKYKDGYNQQFMFRIYFTWHDEEELVIIGHMPSHLDNRLTN